MSATANIDLRKSTFLDFTTDNRVIEQVLGASDDLAVGLFREELTEANRAFTFALYAETVGDDKLLTRVRNEFKTEFETMFDE